MVSKVVTIARPLVNDNHICACEHVEPNSFESQIIPISLYRGKNRAHVVEMGILAGTVVGAANAGRPDELAQGLE